MKLPSDIPPTNFLPNGPDKQILSSAEIYHQSEPINISKTEEVIIENRITKDKELALMKIVYDNLFNKYEEVVQDTYNLNIVSDLLLNANCHIVSVVKECMMNDNRIEYFKAFYVNDESLKFLSNSKKSNILPNYAIIDESKYILNNIKKKMKRKSSQTQKNQTKISTIFTRGFIDKLAKRTVVLPVQTITKLNMVDLIDKFIDRDSLSLINNTNCTNVKVPFAISVPVAEYKRPLKISKEKEKKTCKINTVPVSNPLLPRKGDERISPISHSRVKPRHISQENIKEQKDKIKKENIPHNDGRMTALGSYPLKRNDISKKMLMEEKQAKVVPVMHKDSDIKNRGRTRIFIGSELANKTNRVSPGGGSSRFESSRTYTKSKGGNITKVNSRGKINPFRTQYERNHNAATFIKKLPSNTKTSIKKIVTPRSDKESMLTISKTIKASIVIRPVSALNANYKSKRELKSNNK